jgi:hypothetical protein
MHNLQYSISSCSSVTLPPPPPPQIIVSQPQQSNFQNIIIQHTNVNTKDDNFNEKVEPRLVNNINKLHHQQQKNALIESLISIASSSSSTTTSTSSSSSTSSLSNSEKYYSTVNKNENLLKQQQHQHQNNQIQNIFNECANEILSMDENFKFQNNKTEQQQDNFILKSKPTLSSEYTCSNKSYQVSHDEYENKYKNENTNNSEPLKSLQKNRRRGLDEIFPALKPAIQEAQKHVPIINTSQLLDNSDIDDEEEDDDLKAVENGIDKFQIDDLDWCPASDLGDFEFDDFESKSNNNHRML